MRKLSEYVPEDFEPEIYREWLNEAAFVADNQSDKPKFSMVIPPPNVTGKLHMGHALNCTLQDVLARWKRLQGYEVLWLPGTDHAGIATQNVVERQLDSEGTGREELGRKQFLRRVWDWKKEYGDRIVHQLKALGVSCDWSRERFTLDEGLSRAVTEVFVNLYEDGYIYQGDYIVNWCPRCQTALSDVEVEHKSLDGAWYHIRYPFLSREGYLEVATTRPETMLGDTAVAFHPRDERYQELEGEILSLPLVGREIPVIADNRVDPEFGSGLVKVTPAHDELDFRIGSDHDLPMINLLNRDGTYNQNAGEEYAGLDRSQVRQRVLEDLREQGYLREVEDYQHEVGHCYRCETTIEPYLSKQWFVAMKELAAPAIKAVKNNDVKFHPEHWETTYFEWMENIRDWCISRQIWWGHRIPVWYGPDDKPFVAHDQQTAAAMAEEEYGRVVKLRQEEDVLDTWFSSALWPFSTLGWPEKNDDLEQFYPTDVLSTGFDIIYFWVARMIIMGYYCLDEKPFEDIYIHALIRTEDGQKMSKSLGNAIDPLDIIEEFGCDPLRFTLCALAAQGRDIKLSVDRIKGFRNFANKIWNAAKYLQFALDDQNPEFIYQPIELEDCGRLERWLLSRFKDSVDKITTELENYNFDLYAKHIYQFFWHEYCDWYIEFSKVRLRHCSETEKQHVLRILFRILMETLQILYPVMPHITEKIHRAVSEEQGNLVDRGWPCPPDSWNDPQTENLVEALQEIIRAGRHLKKEFNLQGTKGVKLLLELEDEELQEIFQFEPYITELAGVEQLTAPGSSDSLKDAAVEVLDFGTVYLPLSGLIEVDKEQARLSSEIEDRQARQSQLQGRLDNPQFCNNAPRKVVEQTREELAVVENEIARLEERIEFLEEF